MRVSMSGNGDGGQCGREPRQAGVELMDSSAERVAGDVERHGHQGHGGDDALDLEAEGLIGGDGDGHGVVMLMTVNLPASQRKRLTSAFDA